MFMWKIATGCAENAIPVFTSPPQKLSVGLCSEMHYYYLFGVR